MLSLSSPVSTSTRSQWGELFFLMALSLSRSYVHTLTHTHARTHTQPITLTHPLALTFIQFRPKRIFPPNCFPFFKALSETCYRRSKGSCWFRSLSSRWPPASMEAFGMSAVTKKLVTFDFLWRNNEQKQMLVDEVGSLQHHYVQLTNGHRCRQRRRRCQRRRCRENVVVFFVDGGKKLRRHCRNEWTQHIRSTTCSPCHNDGDDSTKISNL